MKLEQGKNKEPTSDKSSSRREHSTLTLANTDESVLLSGPSSGPNTGRLLPMIFWERFDCLSAVVPAGEEEAEGRPSRSLQLPARRVQ